MNRPTSRVRDHVLSHAARTVCEPLEGRRLLCALHAQHESPVELYPGQTPPERGPESPDAVADIVWVNRGGDRFNEVFGANQDAARRVVDAVIEQYEKWLGSFSYGDGSGNYNLTLEMAADNGPSPNGLGASAILSTTLFGKPKSGKVTIQRGTNGFGQGWFVDSTPNDSAEFAGPIVNAYAGDAQAGSPAAGLADLYTVAAAEIAHCLGLFGGTGMVPLWDAHTVNLFIPDTAEGGGVSHFWTFQGVNIKHLMTGFNSGTPNSFPGAVHTAGPGVPITIQNETYIGAEDVGNALYEFGRRYLPSDTLRLMLRDAYEYASINPDEFGTFYANLNRSTGQVTVRGGEGVSNDQIKVWVDGSTIFTSVDLPVDVPGTGALAGAGNLPAFVTRFNVNDVSSILIQGRDGDDRISIDSIDAGTTITIDGGAGADSIILTGDASRNLDNIAGALTVNGGTGTDKLDVFDANNNFDDTYTLTGAALTRLAFGGINYSNIDQFTLDGGGGANSLLVNGAAAATSYILRAGAGDDFISVGNGNLEGNLPAGPGVLELSAGAGQDTLSFSDITSNSTQETLFSGNRLFKSAPGTGALVSKDINFSGHESLTVGTNELGTFVRGDVTLAGIPTTINTRGGDDTVWLGYNAGNLTALQGNTTVNGGSGTDHLFMWDDFSAENDDTVINTNTVTHPGMATVNWGNGVENLWFEGATGNNTFFLQSSTAAQRVHVYGNNGNDAIWIANNTGNVANTGPAGFDGQAGSDTVYLDDDDFGFGSTYTITGSTLARPNWTGMAYANTETINVYAQNDNNTFDINGTAPGCVTNVYGNNGNDTFNVGGGDFDANIRSNVLLAGQGGSDAVFYDDTADGGGTDQHLFGNAFKKLVHNTTSAASGVATIDTVESVTVRGSGTAADFIKVDSTPAGVNTVLQGNGGDDAITICALTFQRDLTSIQGAITLDGGAGTDSVTVNDDSSTASDDYQIGATLQHAGAANITRVDGTIEQYTLNAAGGNNTFNVEGTPVTLAGTFTINANNGNDAIRISPGFRQMFNIGGHIVANGGAGTDAITTDDFNGAGGVYSLTSTLLVLPANGADLAYATVESLSISGSNNSGDAVNVNSTTALTPVAINGNGGNDNISIGNGNWEANCPGAISVDGGTGTDALSVNDTSDTGNDTYALSATSTTKPGRSVNYAAVESYTFDANGGGNFIDVNSTFPGTLRLNANGGADVIEVWDALLATTVTVDGGAGLDHVGVNSDNSGIAAARFTNAQDLQSLLVGSGGSVTISVGGSNVVRTQQLTISGKLNLTDNPMIVDYTGASPIATIQALVTSGYANGAWQGNGIGTSSADVNRGIGYVEASEVFSSFPATFAGQQVDNTAVLLRLARYGDTNLDGTVNLSDFNRLAANFGQSGKRWFHGDSDYNGTVNLADFNKLAANFGQSGAPTLDDLRKAANADEREIGGLGDLID